MPLPLPLPPPCDACGEAHLPLPFPLPPSSLPTVRQPAVGVTTAVATSVAAAALTRAIAATRWIPRSAATPCPATAPAVELSPAPPLDPATPSLCTSAATRSPTATLVRCRDSAILPPRSMRCLPSYVSRLPSSSISLRRFAASW
eukprot:4034803-Prymnesium_polylepis.2